MSASPILDAILAPGGLTAVFQPIVEVRGPAQRIHGLECLTRGPKGTNMEPAQVLFEYVRRKREETLVDRACVITLLEAARSLPNGLELSINVHAATLERDPEFPGFLQEAAQNRSIPPSRLTVEIVEHAPPWSGRGFLAALEALRHLGVSIALDDVGLGQSNYRLMLDCKPDYFKMDGYFVRGCRFDFFRMAVIESVVKLAGKFGARVVAEGAEDDADVEAVTSLGIDLVQGHRFFPALSPAGLVERHVFEKEGVTT